MTCCVLLFCLLGERASGQSSAPKMQSVQAAATTENASGDLQCENSRIRFAELTCEQKSTLTPESIGYLDIPAYYSTSLLWQDILLTYSQTLYSNQPKDLRASASTALRECIAGCLRAQQCENQVLEYFGMRTSFFSWLNGFSRIDNKNSRRNNKLAAALGESLYKSDAGSLINRHTDIKACMQLKEEAKQNQCNLSSPKK